MSDFNEHLRHIRKSKRVTQKETALAVGVTERNFQDWELGNYKPGFDALIALADYFDVSLDYLVGRSDVKERG
jgi:transcriptional regulator with XRE-family HTH domain